MRTPEEQMLEHAKAIVADDGRWEYAEEWWEDGKSLAEYVLLVHFRSPQTKQELPTAIVALAQTVLLESPVMISLVLDGADWLADDAEEAIQQSGGTRIRELARYVAELPGAG